MSKCLKYSLLIFTFFSLTFFSCPQTFAESVTSITATKSDFEYFSKIYHSNTSLYTVNLLFRRCSKEINGKVYAQGETQTFKYDLDKNLYYNVNNPLEGTIDTDRLGATSMALRYCKPIEKPYYRIQTVLYLKDTVIGWIFESVNSYCILPVYNRVRSVDCYYSHCLLTIPAHTEAIFISPYAKIAESIRSSLKPIPTLDSHVHYENKLCPDIK